MHDLNVRTAKFANLPMLPPYLQPGPHDFTDGSNFASAGAGVLTTTNPGAAVSIELLTADSRTL